MSNEAVGRPIRILLIEANISDARATIGALKDDSERHRVAWVSNSLDTLEFLHQRGKFRRAPRPDLILLSLGLPNDAGEELLSALKSNDSFEHIPTIVLCDSQINEQIKSCESLEVETCISKPVNQERLQLLIEQAKSFTHDRQVSAAV